jgi:hypothetical protein
MMSGMGMFIMMTTQLTSMFTTSHVVIQAWFTLCLASSNW